MTAPPEQPSQSRHKRRGKKKKSSTDNSNVLETPPPPQFQRPMPLPPHLHRPSRQLEFNQAMEDFSNMFPRLDREVIESVLRSNNGAVDVTIDQLLVLDEDTDSLEPSSSLGSSFSSQGFPPSPFSMDHPPPFGEDKPPPYSPPSPNSPFSKYNLKPNNETTAAASAAAPSETERPQPMPKDIQDPFSLSAYPPPLPARKKVYKPALLGPLPDDFLRLPSAVPQRSNHAPQEMVTNDLQERLNENKRQQNAVRKNDKQSQQRLEDERIALLLQNEVFLEELRRNPDFISSLDRDYLNAVQEQQAGEETNSTERATGNSTEPQGAVGGTPAASGSVENIDVRNKLPHMGKTTKTKLSTIAKKFNKKKRKTSKLNLPEPQPTPHNIRPPEVANMRRLDDRVKRQAEENQYASLHPISPPLPQGR